MGALKWLRSEAQESIPHIPVALLLYICPTKKGNSSTPDWYTELQKSWQFSIAAGLINLKKLLSSLDDEHEAYLNCYFLGQRTWHYQSVKKKKSLIRTFSKHQPARCRECGALPSIFPRSAQNNWYYCKNILLTHTSGISPKSYLC